MILERMPTFGFVTCSHGGVSRNHLTILDVDQTQGSNQKRCATMFHSPRFKERGASRYTESWQSYCSCSKRLSSDLMDLLTNRIAQITCKSYTIRSCIGNERCLTGYHQVMSSMELLSEDTWAFQVNIVNQSSSKQWVTTACRIFPKLNLDVVLLFVAWHMVTRLVVSCWT